MNESTAVPNDFEQILGQLFRDMEARGGIVIEEYVVHYPQWAKEIREMTAMHRRIEGAAPGANERLPGRLGEFRIVRRIAHGGMGDIYEAYDERLNRRVAIKTIRHGRISADNRDRFLREQTVLAQLHQSHIVPIYAAGEEGDLQYFAMPYIDGAAVHHIIAAARKLESIQSGSKTPSLAKLAEFVGSAERGARNAKAVTPDDAEQQGSVSTTSFRAEESPADSPTLSPSRPPTLSLSHAYFRSVAEVLADAADALHSAHAAGFIHRDIKPSNLMVDTHGQCWIIDFGLAGIVKSGEQRAESKEASTEPEASGPPLSALCSPLPLSPLTQAGTIQGTPQYMAPEQYAGKADARSDVWGLGVTLYELLTLRRAFDESSYDKVAKKIATEEPMPAREVVRNLPRDLDAICHKAMQKRPDQRYPTAKEFAEDLRRWLRMEPTRARPAWPVRRVAMWARRNKGWAAAMGISVFAMLGMAIAGTIIERQQTGSALKLAAEASARERDQERAAIIQQLQRLRLTPHSVSWNKCTGWSDEAWALVKSAAQLGTDDHLKNQAAATLVGIDARPISVIEFGSSSVAFDRDGNRLLMGGVRDQPARLWDRRTDLMTDSGQAGSGPVGFRTDGTPVQVLVGKGASLWLWDVAERRILNQLRFGNDRIPSAVTTIARNHRTYPIAAINAGVSWTAAIGLTADDQAVIAAWESSREAPVFQKPVANANALVLSPKKNLLAMGDENGRITVWELPGGKEKASLSATRTNINCLAFDQNASRLAAGDAGGRVIIWDLNSRTPTMFPGSLYGAYAAAFSPDGTMLAAAGRGATKLWDAATGRQLLEVQSGDHNTGLAFTRDGSWLAVSTTAPGTSLWRLEHERGMGALRGLAGQISLLQFSPTGRLLAALSHEWQVGIWDIVSRRLVCVLDAPKGLSADNAGLAFDHGETRFAFVAGKEAKLWDVSAGRELGSWNLPPGLVDHLAFDFAGKLFSFRVETKDGKSFPDSDHPFADHPRICRIRELHEDHRIRPIAQKTALNRQVFCAVASPDAACFIADGLHEGPKGPNRQILAFAGSTGKVLWQKQLPYDGTTQMSLDPSGKVLAVQAEGYRLLEALSGAEIGALERFPNGLAPLPQSYWVTGNIGSSGRPHGYGLYRGNRSNALVALGIDSPLDSLFPQFSRDSRLLAWGSPDGTVTLCDIEAVRQRLNAVDLGW